MLKFSKLNTLFFWIFSCGDLDFFWSTGGGNDFFWKKSYMFFGKCHPVKMGEELALKEFFKVKINLHNYDDDCKTMVQRNGGTTE